MRRCLTLIAATTLAAACHSAPRGTDAELALAAAASESVTVALADSIAPSQGFVASQVGMAIESLSACDDRVDARGWETVGSAIVDMELPPGFTGSGQTSQVARWNGPAGWIRAASHSGDAHTGWTGTITSECDVYISGSPAHIDLVTGYGRAVHALVKVSGAPDLALEAQARTIGGQAQLLHAIRYARISAAWGHPY